MNRISSLRRPALCALAAAAAVVAGCGGDDGEQLTVYSGRHYGIETAFEAWSDETGIDVEFLTGNDTELRERIAAEGEDTEADVYLTVDAGNLWAAAEDGLFQPLDSTVLDESVPEQLRDPDNRWFGLAVRARTIVYNTDLVDEAEVPDDLRGVGGAGVGRPTLPAQRQQRLPAVAGGQHDRRRR